jgi:hypothetical protein
LQLRLRCRFARNCRLCGACRGHNRFRGRCYDLWGLCRLYGLYRAFWGRFWFWRGCRGRLWGWFWGYGSHRLNRYRLRARFDRPCNILSSFDISAHILGALDLLSFRCRAWARFRVELITIRGRSNITRVVKQSRVQLSAVTRYSTNKTGELASIATLAKVLGNVAFIQEVVMSVLPSYLELLGVGVRVLAGDCCPSLS